MVKLLVFLLKEVNLEAGEITQGLRALAFLIEDVSLIPRTYMVPYYCLYL